MSPPRKTLMKYYMYTIPQKFSVNREGVVGGAYSVYAAPLDILIMDGKFQWEFRHAVPPPMTKLNLVPE